MKYLEITIDEPGELTTSRPVIPSKPRSTMRRNLPIKSVLIIMRWMSRHSNTTGFVPRENTRTTQAIISISSCLAISTSAWLIWSLNRQSLKQAKNTDPILAISRLSCVRPSSMAVTPSSASARRGPRLKPITVTAIFPACRKRMRRATVGSLRS